MDLVWPAIEQLPSYVRALEHGWCGDTIRPQARESELVDAARDPEAFVATFVDREARGPRIEFPDGTTVARLPGYKMWMWDGEFCGQIGLRWQRGTTDLPPTCLGHIGYSVVPWKQRRGYATRALGLFLVEAKREGLPFVMLTTDEANVPSQKVITANGGRFLEKFGKLATHGGGTGFRYRIDLTS